MSAPAVTVSVVSHAQNALVNQLLGDLGRVCPGQLGLILTENAPDAVALEPQRALCPAQRIVNRQPLGFGANHNQAFGRCATPYFCVVNPDIRLARDPFPALTAHLSAPGIAVAGPLVRAPSGEVENSAHRFLTPAALLRKFFHRRDPPEYPVDRGPVEVDWIAGMFMLFRADAYRLLGGFDEAYFLYYEDVDLCRRLAQKGLKVLYDPTIEVTHDARRASRRNPRLMAHHLSSMLRYLWRYRG
jgi:GT2 family glycosyltransferase